MIANPDTRSSQTADQSSETPGYVPVVRRTRSWELDRANINVIKIIGKGAFSRVGKATAAGIPGTRGEVTVAVKMLKGETRKRVSVLRIENSGEFIVLSKAEDGVTSKLREEWTSRINRKLVSVGEPITGSWQIADPKHEFRRPCTFFAHLWVCDVSFLVVRKRARHGQERPAVGTGADEVSQDPPPRDQAAGMRHRDRYR